MDLIIETSSVCDLKCVMCHHSADDMGRPKIFLSDEIIKKIEPFLHRVKSVQLHGIGEPLISPAFWKILKLIPSDCYSTVNSNFVNISESKIRDLVNSSLKSISISVDSPDKETFYRIRGADLQRVIYNTKLLVSVIKEKESSMRVMYNMTLMKENITQLNKALDLCVEVGCVGLETWPLNNYHGKRFDRKIHGWDFIYEDQHPSKFVDFYNKQVEIAREYAKQIGKGFSSYTI